MRRSRGRRASGPADGLCRAHGKTPRCPGIRAVVRRHRLGYSVPNGRQVALCPFGEPQELLPVPARRKGLRSLPHLRIIKRPEIRKEAGKALLADDRRAVFPDKLSECLVKVHFSLSFLSCLSQGAQAPSPRSCSRARRPSGTTQRPSSDPSGRPSPPGTCRQARSPRQRSRGTRPSGTI